MSVFITHLYSFFITGTFIYFCFCISDLIWNMELVSNIVITYFLKLPFSIFHFRIFFSEIKTFCLIYFTYKNIKYIHESIE